MGREGSQAPGQGSGPTSQGPSQHQGQRGSVWGMSEAAEGYEHREVQGQVAGSALFQVPRCQRAAPAAAGVAKGSDRSTEQSPVLTRRES